MNFRIIIEQAWSDNNITQDVRNAVSYVFKELNHGRMRVCEKLYDSWIINDWLKKAILLYFKMTESHIMYEKFFDKIPLKFDGWTENQFRDANIRVVPGALVRKSAYISSGCVIMPSFINVGAYVNNSTMIDINVTLGSCCYIGQYCHIGANTVIGGVLEPLHDKSVIIEDNVFIGASCSVTSGVLIKQGAVIANGTHISSSTKIYDTINHTVSYGIIPENAVVVSGFLPRKDDAYIACAMIVKYANEDTRKKIEINELLRE